MDNLSDTIKALRRETGVREGCPVCGGAFYEDEGVCIDCGLALDVVMTYIEPTVLVDRANVRKIA